METKNDSIYLSDQEIYEGLLAEDEFVLNALFYGEQFDTVVGIIKAKIYHYTEFNSVKVLAFNDLFELFKNNPQKLHEYEKEGGSILIWLARTFIKHYQEKRKNEIKTEKRRMALLEKRKEIGKSICDDSKDSIIDPEDELEKKEVLERIEIAISKMENKKYADIMRKELLEDDSVIIESINISQDRQRAYIALQKKYFTIHKKVIIWKRRS